MLENTKGLGKELISVVTQSELMSSVSDYAELALDAMLEDGVLQDIPVFGTIINLGKATFTISDRLVIKKIGKFLLPLNDIPADKRKKFAEDLEDDQKRKEVGEKVILILDKQDDFVKAELVGEVFRLLILEEINKDDFNMLCHGITVSSLFDLKCLPYLEEHGFDTTISDTSQGSALTAAGLAAMEVKVPQTIGAVGSAQMGVSFNVNHLGTILSNIMRSREKRNQ